MKHISLFIILIKLLTIFWTNIETVMGISGGREANLYEHKYMVSVQANDKHICGGAIIGQWHILTAAHCVINRNNNQFYNKIFSVVGNIINLQDQQTDGIRENVKSIYVPKEFDYSKQNSEMITGDIAVLKLKSNLVLGSLLKNLNLPPRMSSGHFLKYTNVKASFVGFGFQYLNRGKKRDRDNEQIFHQEFSKLRTARINVIHKNGCKALFPFLVDKKLICARVNQYSDVPEGTCYGDDGGPLVVNEDIIIGILVRNQPDCNEQVITSLYTRISSYIPFINRVMSKKISLDMRIATYRKKEDDLNCSESAVDLVEITDRIENNDLK